MNVRSLAALLALALVSIAGAADKPEKPKSDLAPPDKRRATVELGSVRQVSHILKWDGRRKVGG